MVGGWVPAGGETLVNGAKPIGLCRPLALLSGCCAWALLSVGHLVCTGHVGRASAADGHP